MKRPKDDVFRLIQAMTPAEKRYLKMHFAAEGNVLTDLFDYLNSQEAYDEEQAKAYFPENVSRNFKVYKNQLFLLLLKSLTTFQSKRRVLSKIRMGLEEVDLLTEKGLNDLALEKLRKVKRLAQRYEERSYLIEIVRKEYALSHPAIDKIGISRIVLYDELLQALHTLQREIRLSKISNELLDIDRKKDQLGKKEWRKEDLEATLQSMKVGTDEEQASFLEKLMKNIILTKVADLQGDQSLSRRHRRGNVDLFREYPRFKESMPFHYLAVMRNYLNLCLAEECFEEVQQLIGESVAFADSYPAIRSQLIYFYYGELEMQYQRRQFKELLSQTGPRVLDHLRRYQMERDRIALLIYIYLLMANLAVGKHAEAQRFIRKIEQVAPDLRRQFAQFICLLEWICHYDAGDEFLAENLCKSFLRRTSEADLSADPFLRDLVSFLKQLLSTPDRHAALSRRFRQQLAGYEGHGLCGHFLHYRLDNWLLAVEQGRSLAEAYRRLNG